MPNPPEGVLQGKVVMVTRPAHQADGLIGLLRDQGAQVVRFPVLGIEDPVNTGPLLQQLENLSRFDIAIFISPNAVSRVMNHLHAHHLELPPAMKIATIGKSSARELEKFIGRPPDLVPPSVFNSEALLDMREMHEVKGKHIVIFRGEGGRELLADTLRQRGAHVEYANAYRRIKPDADVSELQRVWARNGIDFIIISSAEGLRNLFDMVGQLAQHWLRQTRLVVINQRLVEVASELGFRLEPVVSEESSDEAIVRALCDWQSARSTT